MVREVRADVAAARQRDPAAQDVSSFEILTSWAGVQALLAHRAAHAPVVAHSQTRIEEAEGKLADWRKLTTSDHFY